MNAWLSAYLLPHEDIPAGIMTTHIYTESLQSGALYLVNLKYNSDTLHYFYVFPLKGSPIQSSFPKQSMDLAKKSEAGRRKYKYWKTKDSS